MLNTIQHHQQKRLKKCTPKTIGVFFYNVGHKVFNFFLPPTCLVCHAIVRPQQEGAVCLQCLKGFSPFGPHKVFAQQQFVNHAFADYHAPFLYTKTAGGLVHQLKYADGLWVTSFMVQHMAACMPHAKLRGFDVITPVPLHKKRLYMRKYNQSAMLARGLSKALATPWEGEELTRVKITATQVGQKARVRRKQLKNAFVASTFFNGKTVLLVDDVCTTGSTAHECALALLSAGAKRVELLTFAYVPPGAN